jgi:hypothetical protein
MFESLKKGFKMNALKSSVSSPTRSLQTKPATLWVSDQLTRSEIDSLRQGKKSISDYVQKVYPDRAALMRACKQQTI